MAQTDFLSLIFPVDFTLFVNKTIKWKVLWTGDDHCGLTGLGPALAPSLQMGVSASRVKDPNIWDYLCWVESKLSPSSVVFCRSVNIFMNGLDKES